MARGMVAEKNSVWRCVRELGDDLADVVDEAHVEHAVGLVEDEHLDVAEAQRVALDEIEQAAGGGHQHVDAVHQRAHLLAHRHAADRQRGADANVAAVGLEAVSIWPDSSRVGLSTSTRQRFALGSPALGVKVMKDRQREGGGLAGAGLRDADDVAARQDDRNGLRLDRRRRVVFLFGQRTQDGFGEAEVVKCGQCKIFLWFETALPRNAAVRVADGVRHPA